MDVLDRTAVGGGSFLTSVLRQRAGLVSLLLRHGTRHCDVRCGLRRDASRDHRRGLRTLSARRVGQAGTHPTPTDHVRWPTQTASNGETVGKNQVNSLYLLSSQFTGL